MFIRVPAFSNTGLVLDSKTCGDTVYLSPPAAESSPSPSPKWQHPGYSVDTRKQIAGVAKARGLIGRRAASSVLDAECETGKDLMPHMSGLASVWDLVAYTFDAGGLCEELRARGPVMAALYVTDELMTHISGLISGDVSASTVYVPALGDSPPRNSGLVTVVVLSPLSDDDTTTTTTTTVVVSLPWGTFRAEAACAWDGSILVSSSCLKNLCSLASRANVSPSRSPSHSVEVRVIDPGWNPVTTRPLPSANVVTPRVVGKTRELKRTVVSSKPAAAAAAPSPTTTTTTTSSPPKSKRHHALVAWFRKDENVSLLLEGVVTATVVVLAIMVIVTLKSRRH